MRGDGVDIAWLWKALKGAAILSCEISLAALKCAACTAVFQQSSFTVGCGKAEISLLAESEEFKDTGSAKH